MAGSPITGTNPTVSKMVWISKAPSACFHASGVNCFLGFPLLPVWLAAAGAEVLCSNRRIAALAALSLPFFITFGAVVLILSSVFALSLDIEAF